MYLRKIEPEGEDWIQLVQDRAQWLAFVNTIMSMMKFPRAISRFKWLSGSSSLRTRTEMVFETLVCSPLNHMTRLIARENFIILSRRESNKCHDNEHFVFLMAN
jgi:hypothetical protein